MNMVEDTLDYLQLLGKRYASRDLSAGEPGNVWFELRGQAAFFVSDFLRCSVRFCQGFVMVMLFHFIADD